MRCVCNYNKNDQKQVPDSVTSYTRIIYSDTHDKFPLILTALINVDP